MVRTTDFVENAELHASRKASKFPCPPVNLLAGFFLSLGTISGYINEEIFELSIFENGDIQAERIFCEQWTRDEYGLQEERLHDDYLREALDIRTEELGDFIRIMSPEKAVDKLSEYVGMSIWSDSEWIPHNENLRNRFGKYEFHFINA